MVTSGSGYIQSIDLDGPLQVASDNDFVVRLERQTDNFVRSAESFGFAFAYGRVSDTVAYDLSNAFSFGPEHTPEYDIEFSLRRIVEIAQLPCLQGTTTRQPRYIAWIVWARFLGFWQIVSFPRAGSWISTGNCGSASPRSLLARGVTVSPCTMIGKTISSVPIWRAFTETCVLRRAGLQGGLAGPPDSGPPRGGIVSFLSRRRPGSRLSPGVSDESLPRPKLVPAYVSPEDPPRSKPGRSSFFPLSSVA
ncbi:DUF2254 domain-containing protein [Rhodobacter sp. NTK016B]|nr:DUF2254 domain-containing protein [Rhodobacter sp. NTK016B]